MVQSENEELKARIAELEQSLAQANEKLAQANETTEQAEPQDTDRVSPHILVWADFVCKPPHWHKRQTLKRGSVEAHPAGATAVASSQRMLTQRDCIRTCAVKHTQIKELEDLKARVVELEGQLSQAHDIAREVRTRDAEKVTGPQKLIRHATAGRGVASTYLSSIQWRVIDPQEGAIFDLKAEVTELKQKLAQNTAAELQQAPAGGASTPQVILLRYTLDESAWIWHTGLVRRSCRVKLI
jgi:cell division septum initiation protein DivIVA